MKPDIDAIMKGMKPMPADGGGDEDDGHMMDLEECGHDVMDAMKSGDAKQFAMAMKDFVSMCGSNPPDEGSDEE